LELFLANEQVMTGETREELSPNQTRSKEKAGALDSNQRVINVRIWLMLQPKSAQIDTSKGATSAFHAHLWSCIHI
jgi:hypothetical protein